MQTSLEYEVATPGIERLTDEEVQALGRRIGEIMKDFKERAEWNHVDIVFSAGVT